MLDITNYKLKITKKIYFRLNKNNSLEYPK